MVLARLGARASLLKGGTLLVVGNAPCVAAGEPTDSQRAEVFDPSSGTWAEVGSLNKERADPALVPRRDGRSMVLVASNPQSQPYSSTKLYSPTARAWSDGPLMLRAGAIDAVTLADGSVFAVGRARAEILGPGAAAWRRSTPPPSSFRVERLRLLTGGDVLAVGERDDEPGLTALLLFDVDKATWRSFPAPDVLRPQFIPLANGASLALGDDEGGGHVQRYDPASTSWAEPAQMAQGRTRAQVTVLPDGRVLVAGGVPLTSSAVDGGYSVTEGPALASTEIYDPATDSWSAGPSLLGPRQGGQAITLGDGSVLVFGGYVESPPPDTSPDTGTPGPCPTPLATSERLQPAS
jgi:hypothetical protein